jgi:4-hydroxy-tetrahydrodipicolinate synthase
MFGVPVSRLAGYAPFLPTPFSAKDRIDRAAFTRLCELLMSEGATALVVGDAAGEATSLDLAEFSDLVHAAARVARKRIPVLAGLVSNATLKAGEFAQVAEQSGADALLCGAPHYNKPTQDGVFAHFQWIAESTELPIFLHDAPARTACAIADATVARLAALPQFIGLVDATGDVARVPRIRAVVAPDFRLLSGDDKTALPFLAQGGDGCLSLAFNTAPGLCRNLYLAWLHGQVPRAQRLSLALAPLAAFLTRDGNPAALKAALAALGVMSPGLRRPLVALPDGGELTGILADLRKCYEDYLLAIPREPLAFSHIAAR